MPRRRSLATGPAFGRSSGRRMWPREKEPYPAWCSMPKPTQGRRSFLGRKTGGVIYNDQTEEDGRHCYFFPCSSACAFTASSEWVLA
jgi:hypothetical protein